MVSGQVDHWLGWTMKKRICELVGQAGMVIGQVDHLLGCTW